jgi:uric acid transporter
LRTLTLGDGRRRWNNAAAGLASEDGGIGRSCPLAVLGGAGLVMFGMVAATGARILTTVDFNNNRYNLFVVAISAGFGMIPLAAPNFFRNLPHDLQPLLEFGILRWSP